MANVPNPLAGMEGQTFTGKGTTAQFPNGIDGAGSWIGNGNGNYRPGSQWTEAERLRLKAIAEQKRKTMMSLDKAQSQAGQQFEQGKTLLSGQYNAGKRSLAEYLSQRGQTSSGVAAQGQIQGLNVLGQGLGQLESTREQALANIELQRAEAERQALEQRADLTGQAQEQAQARDLAAIQAGAYNQDVQAEINRRAAANPNDPMLPFLQAQRNQKLSGIAESEAEARQQEFENQLALARLSGSRSSGGSSGSIGGTTDAPFKPLLTEAQARAGINSENPSYEDYEAYDYYHGTNLLDDFVKANPLDERNYAQSQPIEVLLNQRTDPSGWLSLIRAYYESGRITEEKANALLKQYGLER